MKVLQQHVSASDATPEHRLARFVSSATIAAATCNRTSDYEYRRLRLASAGRHCCLRVAAPANGQGKCPGPDPTRLTGGLCQFQLPATDTPSLNVEQSALNGFALRVSSTRLTKLLCTRHPSTASAASALPHPAQTIAILLL
ncbi:hypothetical protein JDV02_009369 [Purpureocillium takamizusanense]|uniref:Uncharacterized protein n=1 Tax=Purpureocillium takamizusanense TaxID=2060973 RepID=A0A9Q8VFE1_9HYPO|nr:uncharacterized protein JDV02_009369 [Purpureocillium takamizusanense]UNI23553.1 hypothetical protein JDV02_009369 [Purpureocillium takamizusanense]